MTSTYRIDLASTTDAGPITSAEPVPSEPLLLNGPPDDGLRYYSWLDLLMGYRSTHLPYISYPEQALPGQAISDVLPSNVMVPTPSVLGVDANPAIITGTTAMPAFGHIGFDNPLATRLAPLPVLITIATVTYGALMYGAFLVLNKRVVGKKPKSKQRDTAWQETEAPSLGCHEVIMNATASTPSAHERASLG
ncbi:uncharacterized protein AB675_892 [Cyphellophora attinorum]|uniref:Uncharacterized protein n=1 Tax=Cyphellophora attinorum TaxID=1664694 RepID=A0A0N0NSG5_9EURO|nr:uncharacterized protein AB675_892 [Phialophora attinorum]KPI45979.1 hypothetical protein AB675_892 [Phialophora attinorum]